MNTASTITQKSFGTTADGLKATLFTLKNKNGASATITDFGGTVVSLLMPDRQGKFSDVVLGFKTVADYETKSPYFGCLIGRCGNRIAGGKFSLDRKVYHLPVNNGPNSLHGGLKGFHKVLWQATPSITKQGPSLKLTYRSPDGEEGYPGTLSVTATYWLTEKNELKLVYRATTDQKTVVNLTHHSYFNLAGQGRGDILDHLVTLKASRFTPINADLIPTGKIAAVKGTPFDFSTTSRIGARIDEKHEQLQLANGYDHNWIADKEANKLGVIARVEEPTSGRVMTVLSTEPGFQFYTGNFLDGTLVGKSGKGGKGGKVYPFRSGFCIEPQHYPDSPNQKKFPSVILQPGEIYKNTIIYRFTA